MNDDAEHNMSRTTVRILFVYDADEDVVPLERVLIDAGYTPSWERVDTAETLHIALTKQGWDIAIGGSDLAQLRSGEALRLTREQAPTLPFILVGDPIGEEAVVTMIKAGADDFVLRENLPRLSGSVQAALQEAKEPAPSRETLHERNKYRRHLFEKMKEELIHQHILDSTIIDADNAVLDDTGAIKAINEALRHSERRLRTLMNNLPGMAYRCLNDPTWTMLFVSSGCFPLTGHQPSELLQNLDKAYADLIHAKDQAYVWKEVQAALQDERPFELEYRITTADGTEKHVWERGVGVYDSGELLFIEGFITDITERIHAEEQIRLQATVMEAAANAIIITRSDGIITWVNPAFTRLTGYTAEEAIGQNPRILKSDEWDPPHYRDLWRTIFSGSVWQGELINRRKDGRLYTVELTITPVYDEEGEIRYFVGVMQDVTKRKQAEEALRRSEERNRAMIEAIPDLLFRLDARGTVLDFHATQNQLVVPAETLPGLTLHETPIPLDVVANMMASVQETLETGRVVALEYALSMADAMRSFEARLIKSGDEEVIAIVRDITERNQARKDREALIEELEQRNAALERFTYTVSHDLKTPLVTIKGFLGMLKEDVAQANHERVNEDIHIISTAADQMKHLLDDLLHLSRIGQQMNPPEEVALTDLARNAADLAGSQIAQRGVEVEIAEAMPVVLGDRVRLLEVYQNLLENAIKFMGDQPAPRIEIGAQLEGAEVLNWVRDNGVGITSQYHDLVFGLFERLDTTIDGTGMGLALIKRIVEVHGGRIWVESEGGGQGSTFLFTLPAAAQSA